MPSDLDRRYDETLAEIVGPGGRLVLNRDGQGRAIVDNFPATLPALFHTFCALNADNEAIVAGDERLNFAELNRLSERLAHGLVRRGLGTGDRVGLAMRNCPAWVVSYMAIVKAGGIATLLNGWWEAHEMEHAIGLTDPRLIIADAPRARRIAQRCNNRDIASIPIELPVEQALAELLKPADDSRPLPELRPDDDATILFTSGSTGEAKGALSTHRAVTTAVYSYATGLMVLLDLLTD